MSVSIILGKGIAQRCQVNATGSEGCTQVLQQSRGHVVTAGGLRHQLQRCTGNVSDPVIGKQVVVARHLITNVERQDTFGQLRLQETAIVAIGHHELVRVKHPTLDVVKGLGKEFVADPCLAQSPVADQGEKSGDVVGLTA